ncbi:prepilin peptidase [Nanoarchaeota archaeon]
MDILLVIAAIWLIAASFTDLKNREVANWLSFSLLTIALIVRASESIIAWDLTPLTTSLIGLSIFFIIANLLYYGKVFAGGDAKLLIALGAVIPGTAFLSNILITGSFYGLFYSLVLAIVYRKSFVKKLKDQTVNPSYLMIVLLAFFVLGIIFEITILYLFAAAAFFIYIIHLFVRTVEKSCLIKLVSPSELTEGDWLYKNVRLKNKVIKAGFAGLNKREISLIRKANKKVYIKYGIPFIPVFLIAFLITIFFDNLFLYLI